AGDFDRYRGRRGVEPDGLAPSHDFPWLGRRFETGQRAHSTNVTLLISRNVVTPSSTRPTAHSRRNVMPSSRAARLISDVGRRSRIMSRILSVKSISSQIAVRPLKPVPPHSMHPVPS